jgi:mannose-6-phosphate isomerase-like protein (cupin superfamily)
MEVLHRAPLHVRPDEARKLPNEEGHPSARALAHGSMEVRWFQPKAEQLHLPHDRDELYVVVSGMARFHRGVEAGPFGGDKLGLLGEDDFEVAVGDVLFVPAGAEHHFDRLSPDFAVWAIFYGPEGGESP